MAIPSRFWWRCPGDWRSGSPGYLCLVGPGPVNFQRASAHRTCDNEQDPCKSTALIHSFPKSIFLTTIIIMMLMKCIVPLLLILSSASGADDMPDSWYKRYAQYWEGYWDSEETGIWNEISRVSSILFDSGPNATRAKHTSTAR